MFACARACVCVCMCVCVHVWMWKWGKEAKENYEISSAQSKFMRFVFAVISFKCSCKHINRFHRSCGHYYNFVVMLYVCVCVCVCLCMFVCDCVSLFCVFVCARACVFVCARACVCLCVCLLVCFCMSVCVCMCVCVEVLQSPTNITLCCSFSVLDWRQSGLRALQEKTLLGDKYPHTEGRHSLWFSIRLN